MADVAVHAGQVRRRGRPSLARLIAAPGFQRWAARFPLTRRIVRREGEALFDLLAGFCHSQVLMALVQLEIPRILIEGALPLPQLATRCDVPEDRMIVLVRAAVALGLLRMKRGGKVALSRRGAALVGVPGLDAMIRHHDVFYRDLTDPAAFFRGETDPGLARFWPYVFGDEIDPREAATYSDLMAQSQVLVAEDTLDAVDLSGVARLLDVGGGTGAFLAAAGARHAGLELGLLDLPQVVPDAETRFARAGLTERTEIVPGSFREDPLPDGFDAISLVRVLYDHEDTTVAALLTKVNEALPEGGLLIISEPMLGGRGPERAGDVYFALYTMAMGTGKTRAPDEIAALCRDAGFDRITITRATRPYVTRCIVARKG